MLCPLGSDTEQDFDVSAQMIRLPSPYTTYGGVEFDIAQMAGIRAFSAASNRCWLRAFMHL